MRHAAQIPSLAQEPSGPLQREHLGFFWLIGTTQERVFDPDTLKAFKLAPFGSWLFGEVALLPNNDLVAACAAGPLVLADDLLGFKHG